MPEFPAPAFVKWELLAAVVRGHWFFYNQATGEIAIADGSMRVTDRPESCDDGLVLLDRNRAVVLARDSHSDVVNIPTLARRRNTPDSDRWWPGYTPSLRAVLDLTARLLGMRVEISGVCELTYAGAIPGPISTDAAAVEGIAIYITSLQKGKPEEKPEPVSADGPLCIWGYHLDSGEWQILARTPSGFDSKEYLKNIREAHQASWETGGFTSFKVAPDWRAPSTPDQSSPASELSAAQLRDVTYTNYRGSTRRRSIEPTGKLRFGVSNWHPDNEKLSHDA